MERGPLLRVLNDMRGTDQELDLLLAGRPEPLELRNVVAVEELRSVNGLRVTTKQNYLFIDASHVSAAWQVRMDVGLEESPESGA